MSKLLDKFSFTWNDAIDSDWSRIESFFIRAYISAYSNANMTQLGIPESFFSDSTGKEEVLYKYFKDCFITEKDKILSRNPSDKYGINYLLARDANDHPVAFIVFQPNYKSGKIYLRWVTIAPCVHRQGLGKHMMSLIKDRYSTYHGVELYTRNLNEGAIAFYTGLGFTPADIGHADDAIFRYAIFRTYKQNTLYPPADEGIKDEDISHYISFTLNR